MSCRIYPSSPHAVESTGLVWEWNTRDWSDAGHYEIPAGLSAAALSPKSLVIALALQDGTIRFLCYRYRAVEAYSRCRNGRWQRSCDYAGSQI
jgi:hypothetical protein